MVARRSVRVDASALPADTVRARVYVQVLSEWSEGKPATPLACVQSLSVWKSVGSPIYKKRQANPPNKKKVVAVQNLSVQLADSSSAPSHTYLSPSYKKK